jgi:hypothetical protein
MRRIGWLAKAAALLALCPLLLLTVSCQLTTAPGFQDLVLEVNAPSMAHSRGGGEVEFSFAVQNRGGETAFLQGCGDDLLFELQREREGVWVGVRAALCLTVYDMSPLPLAPGAAAHGTYRVEPVPGRYRLVLLSRDAAGEERSLISGPFVVE